MNILILSSYNPHKNAGIVAKDLLEGLRNIPGNNVKLLVNVYDKYIDDDIESIEGCFHHYKKWIHRKTKRLFVKLKVKRDKRSNIDSNYCVQDYDQTITYYSTGEILKKIDSKPDVIIVLFMHNFLSFKNLFELNKAINVHIFILLPDIAPLTGGCHYAWECKGYTEKCGNCPAINSSTENDFSRKVWEYKYNYIEKTDITVIAGSEWQWQQINNSSLFRNKNKAKILSPTNEKLFRPIDKNIARQSLNLPIDKIILFFGAVNTNEKRKGYKELVKSLQILYRKLSDIQKDNILVVIAGKASGCSKYDIPFNMHFMGYMKHKELSATYQSADIFLNASIEDSGPTMINQAIMSGTPVVAFEMGVASDLVKNGVTGYLAKLHDTEDFANGVKGMLALSEANYKKVSKNCRELALSTCSRSKVANVFQQLILRKDEHE